MPQESCTEHLTRNDSSMGIGWVCTSRTRVVGRLCELANNLVHQIFMLPARAIALDHVSSAVIDMGLGVVVTNPDDHRWMERTDYWGRASTTAHDARAPLDCRWRWHLALAVSYFETLSSELPRDLLRLAANSISCDVMARAMLRICSLISLWRSLEAKACSCAFM